MRSLWLVTAALVLASNGCASNHAEVSRQSVQELFIDALAHSRVRHEDPAEAALRAVDGEIPPEEVFGIDETPPPLALPPDRASPRVSDTFVDTDIRQAITALAAQANVSLTFDQRVQGQANGIIEDEPFEVALQRLLFPLGFVFKKQDDRAYLIGVPDPDSSLFPLMSVRREFRPRHLGPEELQRMLPERHQPFLRVNEKQNLIVVEAHPALADRILWEIRRSDQAVPQVILEAIVCVISPDERFRFGLDFEQGLGIGGGDFANIAMRNLDLSAELGPDDLDTLRSFEFTSIFLRALAQEGYLGIRAAPRVMARSGEKAEINIGRETFFGIQPEIDHRLLRQEIREIESGILLDIRPVVRGSNILVHIERAEVSEDLRVDNGNNGMANRFPIINRRRVSTTVELEDGKTIVIGGLVQRRAMDQTGRIPGLSDVPGVGGAFEQIDRQTEQAEVAIFITARIVERQ